MEPKSTSETDNRFATIKLFFDKEYKDRSSKNQSESSSKRGNVSTKVDSSATLDSSEERRPKANQEETTSELPHHDVHGFTNEILFLMNFLLKQKESKEFKTLAIVGKHGVGKTTLCQVVFNDKDVKRAYFPRIWVSMYSKEEDQDPIAVVKRILKSLGVEKETFDYSSKVEARERDEETAQEKKLSWLLYALNSYLIGKKYLIVLDDVWGDNKWNQRLDDENQHGKKSHLSRGFPKGSGGRVIVTSRDEGFAKKIVGEEENLQRLFPRFDPESVWEIYKDAVKEANMDVTPRYPWRFKQELMDKSCGVPMAVRLLGKIKPVKMDEVTEKK